MKLLGGIVVFAVIMAALFLGLIYSGVYNIAATVPHTALGRWLLQTTMEQSVRRRAEGIESPRLTDPVKIEGGFHSYREMCVTCHGAPGVSPSEIGKGLTPEPPDLAEQAQRWTPAELFWITKHGVKMTGMPAWGPSHTDEELWEIVAFVNRLPELSPEDYRALEAAVGEAGHGHDHGHDQPGEHPH